jgi:hypothetical protein
MEYITENEIDGHFTDLSQWSLRLSDRCLLPHEHCENEFDSQSNNKFLIVIVLSSVGVDNRANPSLRALTAVCTFHKC